MPRQSAQLVIGIVASWAGPTQNLPLELYQAARRHGIDLREIDVQSLEGLVPPALSRMTPAWCILYAATADTDLLLIPLTGILAESTATGHGILQADRIFELIRPNRNTAWSVGLGYRHLIEAEKSQRLPDTLRCFQAIRLPAPMREFFRGAILRGRNVLSSRWVDGLSGWFTDIGERIAAKRRVLRTALADGVKPEEAEAAFDSQLLAEAMRMAERARHERLAPDPPLLSFLLADGRLDGLDPESVRFLETALLVEELGVQHADRRFDFMAAAVPLFKVVERELNLSIGWLVRVLRDVASHSSPWLARPDRDPYERVDVPTGHDPDQIMDLNQRDPADLQRLKGLMLGALQHLLGFAEHNGVRAEIMAQGLGGDWTEEALERFLFARPRRRSLSLQRAIAKLSGLRNPHAHDRAMDQTDYDAVKAAVLEPFHDQAVSLIGRIVSLKQAIGHFVVRLNDLSASSSSPEGTDTSATR